ncbi:MAG: aminotransferase class V-fold PLP-dependent enzyme, partial [Microbacterium sp.]
MTSTPAVAPAESASGTALHQSPLIDVAQERRRTAGTARAHHFNAAGAALPTRGVVATVIDHVRREEERGGYEAAAEMRDHLEAVYSSAARLIGADASEIALFDSASTGLRVMLEALRPVRGQRIVASTSTYVSHALHLMTLAREHEIELIIAPTDAERRVDIDALEAIVAGGPPAIVTAAHIPTSSGMVEPAARIGEVVARHGGVYILDATQSVGHLEMDVDALGCDVLVTTGRKFLRAPRGTGFAYVRSTLMQRLHPTAPDVRGSQWTQAMGWDVDESARRFETWEASIAGRLGLGVALDDAWERGMPATQSWLIAAGAALRAALSEIPGVVIADPDGSTSAIVTFTIEGVAAADAVARLAETDVSVVTVPATHGQWDLGDRGIASVVRASAHVYNDDVDRAALCAAVARVAAARPGG